MSEQATATTDATPVEAAKVIKPLDSYDPSLVKAVNKVNGIAEQANAEQTFLKTKTGDESERIKSIAESGKSEKLDSLRQQREKILKGLAKVDAEILEAATHEFHNNPNYKPLSEEDVAKKKAKIVELRELHKAGMTAIEFVASMSLEAPEIEELIADHVTQIERATRGLLTGNTGAGSGAGAIKPRIQNLHVNGTKIEDDKGGATFTLLSQKLKNFSLKLSGAELSQMAMDAYKVNEWSGLPDTDISFEIPAPTTDDAQNVILIRFDKK